MSHYGGIPDTSAERERRFQRKRLLRDFTPEAQDAYKQWRLQALRWYGQGILSWDEYRLLDEHEEGTWEVAKHIADRERDHQRQIAAEYQADAVKAINKAVRSVVPQRVPWWRRLFSKGAR